MKLVVGLGNPGIQYAQTRHNAGYKVIDALCLWQKQVTGNAVSSARERATKNGAKLKVDTKLKADWLKTNLNGPDVILAKPTTYMNGSGESVSLIIRWFKLSIDDLLVVHDNVSLPFGRLRLQRGGGAGGQHGVESIIAELSGQKSFDRLKIGVGPDPGGDRRAQYVLSAPALEDQDLFEKVIGIAAEAAVSWLVRGAQPTMNVFNGLVLGELGTAWTVP